VITIHPQIYLVYNLKNENKNQIPSSNDFKMIASSIIILIYSKSILIYSNEDMIHNQVYQVPNLKPKDSSLP
jgi:hypothetical protein